MRRISAAVLAGGFALLAYGCRGTSAPTAPHVRLSAIPANVMRAAILSRKIRGKRPAPGIRLAGPPVLKRPLDQRAARKLHVRVGHVTMLEHGHLVDPVVVATPPTTGINRWWSYEESLLPGVGKYMVNVGTGNLIAQSDDIDVPERGIDLAFRRTYNSMSGRDYVNTDGSSNPGQFGGGWTNTFDAHIATNNLGGISVFDIDGARYDYTLSGGGCLTPPAGMFNQLCTDGANGYFWYKKTGTVYYFWRPDLAVVLPTQAGYAGRLIAIWGRNYNNKIIFTYSWDGGDSSSAAKLNQIVAQHSDGQTLTLSFADFSGQRLLQSIRRPDGVSIPYTYDSTGNLLTVAEPANGSPNTTQTYNYNTLPIHQLSWVASPRWTTGTWGTDGGYVSFGYSSGMLNTVAHVGIMNPIPADGQNTPIQSGVPTGSFQYATDTYTAGSGQATLSDTDGHATTWFYDSSGRVTHKQETTGDASGPTVLDTYIGWDAQNNLISSTDARGYETDYAYDNNGNAIAVALPSVFTNSGTFRPTNLYSYDSSNNVTAYCDPVQTHARGLDWTTRPAPSDTLCASSTGAARYTWDTSDSNEPYGRLSDAYTPLGYHHHFAYDPSLQASTDAGLPTSIDGDSFTQADGTMLSPHQGLHYDATGNLMQYDTGSGSWHLTYDSLNRLTTAQDPDGVLSYKYYFANSQLQKTESAYQHAKNLGVPYRYDGDGNETQEKHAHGGYYAAGGSPTLGGLLATQKYYDGADRLVEVMQPQDNGGIGTPNDFYTNPWITRYLYDYSQNGMVSYNGSTSLKAHGNLYKTEELLPPGTGTVLWRSLYDPPQLANTQFQDIKATAFDALDRPTAKYSLVTQPLGEVVSAETLTYDGTSDSLGALTQDCNALNLCTSYSYDSNAKTTAVTFNDPSSPNRTMSYDPDGRAILVSSATFGAQTYAFDADGRMTISQDPTGGSVTSPAALTHNYYPNGMSQSLDVSSSAFTQLGLFKYSYRADGQMQTRDINYVIPPDQHGHGGGPVTTRVAYTYKPSGRMLTRAESGPGGNPTPTTASYDPTYGFMTSEAFPAGTLGSFEYSAEAEPLGNTIPASSVYNFYTTRGELYSSSAMFRTSNRYANGIAVPSRQFEVAWDDRMGVMTYQDPGTGTNTAFSFDLAGRLTKEETNALDFTGDDIRTYDVENHLISVQNNTAIGIPSAPITYQTQYQWGPNGHPILMGGASGTPPPQIQYDTLHWDGDQLLFTTNSQGKVDDIKIGTEGDLVPTITPQGTTALSALFYDRGPGGSIAFCHNGTSATGTGKSDPYHQTSKHGTTAVDPCTLDGGKILWWSDPSSLNGIPAPLMGQGGILGMPGVDGITDGLSTIQGARAYAPSVGAWTAPDAYAGNVHDPVSQKSYMWNRNNPITYVDPSGFIPTIELSEGATELDADLARAAINQYISGSASLPNNSPGHRLGDFLKSNASIKLVLILDAKVRPKQEAGNTRAEILSSTAVRLFVGQIKNDVKNTDDQHIAIEAGIIDLGPAAAMGGFLGKDLQKAYQDAWDFYQAMKNKDDYQIDNLQNVDFAKPVSNTLCDESCDSIPPPGSSGADQSGQPVVIDAQLL